MENELSTNVSIGELMAAAKEASTVEEKDLASVTQAHGYLPYIRLMGSSNEEVKAGQFPMGHFALVKSRTNYDLSDQFHAIILGVRPKAMVYKPDVLNIFDVNSDQYKEIAKRSKAKDSNCGFGPEFLLWLPESECYATYFLGNPTGRNASENAVEIFRNKNGHVTAKAELIKGRDYTWHGPKFNHYEHELAVPNDMAMLQDILYKFNNPSMVEVELPEEAEAEERD